MQKTVIFFDSDNMITLVTAAITLCWMFLSVVLFLSGCCLLSVSNPNVPQVLWLCYILWPMYFFSADYRRLCCCSGTMRCLRSFWWICMALTSWCSWYRHRTRRCFIAQSWLYHIKRDVSNWHHLFVRKTLPPLARRNVMMLLMLRRIQ